MKFAENLRAGSFIKRYKRFFADVKVGDEVVVAHVPNTGSLKSCLEPGSECIVALTDNPARKLKATLHFMKTPTTWVGVNTSLTNGLVFEAWQTRQIESWTEFTFCKPEHKISKESRLDFVFANDLAHFESGKALHYVEVKNVTYAEGDTALFPDAVSTRAQKHLLELMDLRRQGHGAELVFVVQRHDCRFFSPADAIDPEYGRLLRTALAAGVSVRAFACEIDPHRGVSLSKTLLELKF